MKHWQRFSLIFILFIASIIVINSSTKAPRAINNNAFKVACIPATNPTISDRQLLPYAQIAHTTYCEEDPNQPLRCYLRFKPRDIICVPKKIATRKGVEQCPQYPGIAGNASKRCYILNKEFEPLLQLLQKKPPVPIETYANPKRSIVKTWQEARDILLHHKKKASTTNDDASLQFDNTMKQ